MSVINADSIVTEFGVKDSDITYSNLSVQVSDIGDYNCYMSFALNIGHTSYNIVATGLLDEYELSPHNFILHGCLRGVAEIDGSWYSVTVGLTKERDNDSINAGVVLMPNENGLSDNIIVFGMGDYIIPANAKAVLFGHDSYDADVSLLDNSHSMLTSDETVGDVLTVSANISDSIAQSIRVSVKPDMDAVRRYMYKHFSYTGDENGNGAGVTYTIDSMQVGVRKSSPLFNLAGIYTGHVEDDSDYSDFESVIWAVIFDVLNVCGMPTNTIASFEKRSDPPKLDSPNNCYLTLSGKHLYDGIGTYGVGAEFATAPSTSMTHGTANATAYGNATFKVFQNIPLSGGYSFYIDANESTRLVRVTVG